MRKRQIDRDFTHQVEIPVALCVGEHGHDVRRFCTDKPAARRRYFARRNGQEFLTWCFRMRRHAQAFARRFGGRYITPERHCGQCLSLRYDRKTPDPIGS